MIFEIFYMLLGILYMCSGDSLVSQWLFDAYALCGMIYLYKNVEDVFIMNG